jgi:hypothetical protein
MTVPLPGKQSPDACCGEGSRWHHTQPILSGVQFSETHLSLLSGLFEGGCFFGVSGLGGGREISPGGLKGKYAILAMWVNFV